MKKGCKKNNRGRSVSHGKVVRKPSRTENGFTLIEVLVAVVIFGLAYVAIMENFSVSLGNIVRIEKSRDRSFQEMLAFEQQLESEEDNDDIVLLEGDEPFLKGNRYQLVPLRSMDGDFQTLKLEKL